MKIIKLKYDKIQLIEPRLSICLGYFDGVHLGHEELILNASILTSNPLGLLTFDRPVSDFINNGKSNEVITSVDDKIRLLNHYQLDYLIVLEIDKDFLNYSPLEFINKILIPLGVKEVFCGEDYTFGKKALGNISLLKQYFNVSSFELIKIDNEKVSTQTIIKYIKQGDIKTANKLLGHPYEVVGNIKHGYGRGAKIGFPTANLDLNANYVIPKFGVYKCVAYVRGVPHVAIVNVGVHPTVGSLDKPLIEVHIPNFTQITYGMIIYLVFIDFVREEKKFNNVDELKKQIQEDLMTVDVDII